MRATGIVRRIDELGRVVIPKEIRRTLRIREGDPQQTALEGDAQEDAQMLLTVRLRLWLRRKKGLNLYRMKWLNPFVIPLGLL